MTMIDLLSQLREAGVQLTLDGDKLKVKAPQGALTDELKEQLKQHKEGIIAFLQGATAEVKAQAFPPVDRNSPLPLSYNQQGLWFFEQLTPGTAAYTMPIAFKLYGQLNVSALKNAIAKVMQRQECLRSRFIADEQGVAHVVIDPFIDVPFECVDQVINPDQMDTIVRERVSQHALSTFDLERGPLFRLQCVVLRDIHGVTLANLLVGAMHHIISDGWSMNLFVKEIFIAYLQEVVSLPIPAPHLPVQYVDFSAWQQDYLKSDIYAKRLAYWEQHLKGIPSHLALPTDNPRPFVQGNNGGKYEFLLDSSLAQQFAEFCRSNDVTLFMGLMAAWKFVLYRYSAQEDFCLGIPMAGRNHKELENLIGLFIDPLIVRSPLSANRTLQENLIAVKQEILSAFDHQEVPLAQIVDRLQVPRNPAYAPIVQIGFQLQNFSGVIADAEIDKSLYSQIETLSHLRIERVKIEDVASKFDMIVSLSQATNALSGYIEYNADIFTPQTMARMVGHLATSMEALMTHGEVLLRDLPLVTQDELKTALHAEHAAAIRPLTDTQMLLYMDAAMNPETVQNSIGTLIDLPYAIDLKKLQAAIQHVVDTYSIYRTRFVPCDISWAEKVYQVVLPEVFVPLPIEDAIDFDCEQLGNRARAWVYTSYDIHGDELFAFKLYRRGEASWLLAMKAHHIVVDGTSLVYWTDKLGQCYDALMAGEPLPQWVDRYEEFIEIRRREVDKHDTLQFWREKFASCTPLSISRVPGARREADFEVLDHVIDAEHSRKIQQFCKKNRTHPVDYFRLLTELLIRHYCRPEGSFVFNEIQNGRANAKDDTLGVFYQAVPWVVAPESLSSDLALRQCYDGMSAYRKEIRNHRQYSVLAQIHATDPASIFFQFNYFNFLAEHVWQGQLLHTDLQSAHVERTVQCFIKELPETYLLQLWCDRTAFDDHRYLERVAWLSRQIVDGNVHTIGDLRFVLPDEEVQLERINKVSATLPPVASVIDMFEQTVSQFGHKSAVRHGDHALSYAELNSRANRLARALHDQDVGQGSRVGILLGRRVEMLVAVLAVLKSRASYVPIEASYPCERIRYIVQDSGIRAIITEDCQLDKLGDTGAWIFDVDTDAPQLSRFSTDNLSDKPKGTDEIYVIYTSGSTGQPKGASVHHRGEINLQQWYLQSLQLSAIDKTLIVSAFGFDLTQKNLYALLLVGGTVVLPVMDEYDDAVIRDTIHAHDITLINCAPSAFYPLVSAPEYYSKVDSLRWVVLGGEPIRLPLLFPWLSSESCIARLVNSYGPTECTDVVAFHILESLEDDQALIPIGLPVPNCELHILDHALVPVAPGLIGELCVSGVCVGNGYIGRPDLTAQVFVGNPFGAEGKLYKTGDLCRQLPGGEIEYIGRKDFQVKVRGLRIELGEIERVLTEKTDVADCLVLVHDEKLVAYVIAASHCDMSALREHLRSRLPEYMVPGVILRLDAWPLTPNGKVDRKALPLPNQVVGRSLYVAPRNEVERRLVQIWEEVLRLDSIGVDDNFFELGGHSLLATQIVSRTRKAFNATLALRDLLSDPTIAALAERIASGFVSNVENRLIHADRNSRIPLSYAQQRLWLLDRIEPGNVAYNVPIAVRIKGELQVGALQQAISDVINRHESLRTCFHEDDAGAAQFFLPVQRWVTREETVEFTTLDHEFEIRRRVGQHIAHSFDLSDGPLFQSSLLKLGNKEWIYLFVAHHIVTDGWSMGVFIREVLTAYLAYSRGLPMPLAPVNLQYADFSVWQRQQLGEQVLADKLAYWVRTLEDLPILALPTDYPRPHVQTYNGATWNFEFDNEITSSIERIARAEQVTPFSVLMSLFAAVLSRYSNQDDFAIGTPVAGRDSPELENIIGFFVNTVALRVSTDGLLTLREMMHQIAEIATNAFEHQDIPFENIVDAVAPARDMSRSPLFQVMMVLQNVPFDNSTLSEIARHVSDVSISAVDSPVETAKFDITLSFAPGIQGFQAALQYNTDLFSQSSMQMLSMHLIAVARAWLATPDTCLKDLDILTDRERAVLIHERNRTQCGFNQQSAVQGLFAKSVQQYANRKAIVCGGGALTYQQLDDASQKVAFALLTAGVKPGDRVGVCFDRSLHLMTALVGVVKCGATYVPIDASYPRGRISYMVQAASISHVVTRASLEHCLPTVIVCHDVDAIVASSADLPLIDLPKGNPSDIFYVIFTSGSTGNPKGAAVFQRSEVNLLNWYSQTFSMTPDDRVLLMSAIGFDLTQKNLWAPLLSGASLEIPDFQEYDASAFASLVETRGITWINCAPSAFYPLVDAEINAGRYPSLRWVFLGGEPINFSRLAEWYRRVETQVVNSYGPTECTDIASYYVVPRNHPEHARVPIGKPNDNVQLYVLGRYGELLPDGATGELYIGGEGVGAGYLGDSDQTNRVFVEHPLASRGNGLVSRLYKTGDLVRYLAEGQIDYLGRIDQQIKLRGYRIEIDEIQAVINDVEGVVESHVAIQGDGSSQFLAAWIVSSTDVDGDALRKALEQRTADYLPMFMRPSAYVMMERFPLTPNGKIDRKALPPVVVLGEEDMVEPSTALQRDVAHVWCVALGIEKVGMTSNFFAVGGNSLVATQIVAKINKRFNALITVRSLFDNPIFEDFCHHLEISERGANLTPIKPRSLIGDHPLSYGQSRLWYFEQLNPGTSVNNIPGALLIRGALDVDAMRFAVNELHHRHAVLRARFRLDGENGPVQRIESDVTVNFVQIDAGTLDTDSVTAFVATRLEHQANTPFDLTLGPLLRIELYRLPDTLDANGQEIVQHALVFCMHHIASDGISMNVLLRELMVHYASYVSRKPLLLPALKVQYTDYAYWQREWLASSDLGDQLQYWNRQLCNAPDFNTFPGDYERPAVQSTRGEVLHYTLDSHLTAAVECFSKSRNITPFVLTLAAWKMLLCRYNQREDISVGVPTAGRSHPELEPLIGFFVNSVIIRSHWSHNATLSEVLSAVKESTLGAFANGNVPLDLIMQRLPIKRSMSHTPIVQVAFQLFSESEQASFDTLGNFTNLEVEMVQAKRSTANFDVTLNLQHSNACIKAALEYNVDLYKRSTMETLWQQYVLLLQALIEHPDMPLQALQLHSPSLLLNALEIPADQYAAVIPLTHMQRDMFIDNIVNPQSLQSSHGWVIHLHKPLDQQLWQQAINAYFSHYGVARARYVTSFSPALDVGYLAIPRDTNIKIDYIDKNGELHGRQEVEAFLADFIYRPYNPVEDDLVKFRIVKAAEDHYAVCVSAHHAIFDGVGLTTLWQQIAGCYNALREGRNFAFADDIYLTHVEEDRQTKDTAEVLEFWKHTLATVEPLDFTVPPPVPVADKARLIERFVSDDHLAEIRSYCRKQKITPAIYFKCLYALLIDLYCRPDSDFSLQETMSGRTQTHAMQPGCYIQEVPFVVPKSVLQPNERLDSLWEHARDYQKKIKDYRLISLGAQARLSPRGRIGFMYNFYQFVPQTLELAGDIIEDPQGTPSDPANNVQFVVSFVGGRLRLSLYYHPHLFDDRNMLARIEAVSRQIISQDVERVGGLQWVTDASESRLLLQEWNATEIRFDLEQPMHVRFQQQVQRVPQALAIVDDHRTLTYAELDRYSSQLAHHLIALGARKGDLIGLCVERSCEFLIGILGILKTGAAYVPMDAHYPQDRITYMRENSQARIIVSQWTLAEKIGHVAATGNEKSFTPVFIDSEWHHISMHSDSTPEVSVEPSAVAYMLYTSGSTGLPKGALIRHDGALNHIEAERKVLEFDGAFNFLQTAPASSDISVWQFLGPVTCGGTVVVLDEVTQADKMFALVNRYQVNVVELVPVAWQLLIEHVKSLTESERVMPSLKWLMATGEAVPVPMVNEWLSLFPHIPVVNAYGPTEAADDVIQNTITRPLPADVRSVPIGKPLANMNVFIVDEHLRLVPPGIPGEICLSGIGVGNGYWQNSEKTASAFVPNPFPGTLGSTIYKTGDLGRWLNDGTVEYLDRVDNQVKIRGFRIELGEVEAVLAAQPQVAESAVIVRKDMPGGPALVGYVVPHDHIDDIDVTALRAGMRERLPEYMVPAAIVTLDAFPTTPAGKMDKKNLPAPTEQVDSHYLAPSTELETTLAAAYASVLGREQISVDREFFDLGGNSLMAVRLVTRLSQTLSLNLSVAQLLRTSSVQALAQWIVSADSTEPHGPLVEMQKGEAGKPAILFVHPVGGDVLCYHDLRTQWDASTGIYGLRSPGLEEGSAPVNDLDDLLARYVGAIEQTGIREWTLMGQSLGGVLALAIAETLQARGHQIHGLVMLDTFHPAVMKTRPDRLLPDALGLQLPKAMAESVDFSTDGWIDNVYNYATALKLVPADLTLSRIKRIYNVARANEQLVQQFGVPAEVHYPVLLVAARDNIERSTQGWSDTALGFAFDEHAGNHETLMRGENARGLSVTIKRFMQSIDASSKQ